MYVVIAILLIIIVIFGVSSGMQSYATAQQAQAQIETAKAAQISASGNLVTILMIVLFLVVIVALVALVLWFLYRRSVQPVHRAGQMAISRPRVVSDQPPIDVNTLMQIKMLEILSSMGPRPADHPHTQSLSGPDEQDPDRDLFPWLR